MKVKELIKELQNYPEDSEIRVYLGNTSAYIFGVEASGNVYDPNVYIIIPDECDRVGAWS